jgi:hypothetical protein
MKKYVKAKQTLILTLLTTLIIAGANAGAFPTDKPTIYVDPPNFAATKLGKNFKINVTIFQVTNLYIYEFRLNFNNSLLKGLSVTLGNFFPPPPKSIIGKLEINNEIGQVSVEVSLSDGQSPRSGNGTLATITFNATYVTPFGEPPASCALDLYNTYLYGYGSPPPFIPHYTQDGYYESPTAAPALTLTVATEKDSYYLEENVKIYGTLSGDHHTITDALVAVEVDNPANNFIVIRTVPTGTIPPSNWTVEMTEMFPCDKYENPQYSFQVNTIAHFKATIKNRSAQAQAVWATFNVYDSRTYPLGIALHQTSLISPGGERNVTVSFPISGDAYSGSAVVYASTLTDWIRNGGVSLCPEKSKTFTIVGGKGQGAGAVSQIYTVGNYSLAFRMPSDQQIGIYTIYTSTSYQEQNAYGFATFRVKLPDVDGDGKVTLVDLVFVAKAYGSKPGDSNWDPRCDLDGNGQVGLSDLVIIAKNYGRTA